MFEVEINEEQKVRDYFTLYKPGILSRIKSMLKGESGGSYYVFLRWAIKHLYYIDLDSNIDDMEDFMRMVFRYAVIIGYIQINSEFGEVIEPFEKKIKKGITTYELSMEIITNVKHPLINVFNNGKYNNEFINTSYSKLHNILLNYYPYFSLTTNINHFFKNNHAKRLDLLVCQTIHSNLDDFMNFKLTIENEEQLKERIKDRDYKTTSLKLLAIILYNAVENRLFGIGDEISVDKNINYYPLLETEKVSLKKIPIIDYDPDENIVTIDYSVFRGKNSISPIKFAIKNIRKDGETIKEYLISSIGIQEY